MIYVCEKVKLQKTRLNIAYFSKKNSYSDSHVLVNYNA